MCKCMCNVCKCEKIENNPKKERFLKRGGEAESGVSYSRVRLRNVRKIERRRLYNQRLMAESPGTRRWEKDRNAGVLKREAWLCHE